MVHLLHNAGGVHDDADIGVDSRLRGYTEQRGTVIAIAADIDAVGITTPSGTNMQQRPTDNLRLAPRGDEDRRATRG